MRIERKEKNTEKGFPLMKKHTLTRLLSLALAALMLLGLSLSVLTGCKSDEKQSETVTETETETETEVPLDKAEPVDALSRVVNQMSSNVQSAAKSVAEDAAVGHFTFASKTNLKVEAQVVLTTKMTLLGTTETTETTMTAAVTVAENGVSVQVTVPQLADISVVCVDGNVYMSTTLLGSEQTVRYTLDSKMQSELADLLNGKLTDSDAQTAAALDSIRSSLENTGVADIFQSVTTKPDGEKLTISCNGLKTGFIDTLTKAMEKAMQLVKDKTAADTSDPDSDFASSDDSGILDSLVEMFRSVKPDDFSLDVDVNMDGQVLAVRAKATVLQSETEEYGTMESENAIAVSVTVTRGGQTVEKPANADSYELDTLPFGEEDTAEAGGQLD